jgi:glutamyl-tRNA reductase
VSASAPVLTRGMLERAIAKRNGKSMFAVDLGVPRNIAEDASGLYSFYVYNIDDLGAIVEQNRKARESEIPRAEALIDEHVKKFEAWRTALEAGSIVSDLRERFHAQREALVREMLAERGGAGALTAEEQERISRVTTELVEKLLEQPTETLKRGPGMRGRTAGLEAIRHLFKLDGESE